MAIYKIECVSTGKFYIGSTKDTRLRWSSHRHELRNNKHANTYLQNAWRKHGENNFIFSIIETILNQNELLEREQYWLDKTKCYEEEIGFNLCRKVELVRTGPPTVNQINAASRNYIVTSPSGENYNVKNLSKFCRDFRLTVQSMWAVSRGTASHYRGWLCRRSDMTEEELEKLKEKYHIGKQKRRWIITYPNGNEIEISNLAEFCRTEGLLQGNMIGVAQGRHAVCKGYKCRYAQMTKEEWENTKKVNKFKTTIWKIILPNKTEIITDNLVTFSKDHGLSYGQMKLVGRGILKHHRGYICKTAA